MKIVLLEPVGTGIPPLGLLYLSACLKKAGFQDITLCSINESAGSFKRSREFFLQQLSEKPLVLVTSTTPVWKNAFELAKIAKEKGCTIVVGGPAPSIFGKQVLERYPFIDAAVIGEGELVIGKVAKAAAAKKGFEGIPGVVWRKNAKIVENEKNPLIQDLNSLPFPDFGLLDFPTYHGAFSIMTSRGCPYNCEFCFKPVHGNIFRARSPKSVLEEIKWIIQEFPQEFEKAGRTIVFADDIFNFDLERSKAIARAIINVGLKIRLVSVNGFHVRTVDFELFQLLKKAGLEVLWFGVDSGSERVLKNLGKGITLEMVRNAVKLAKKAGIPTVGAHFIIGLSGETLEAARETIAFARSLPLDEVGFNHANVLPGTRLWDYALKHGTLLHETDGFDFSAFKQLNSGVIFETPEFPKKDREKAFEEAVQVIDYFRRKHIMTPKRFLLFLKEIKSLDDFFWALGRIKVFLFAKNLRAQKRPPKPSDLKSQNPFSSSY